MKIDENFFNSNIINGIILFLFPGSFRYVFSNFASPELIRTLKNNDYIRLIVLYFIIFFFIRNILSRQLNKDEITTELLVSFIILIVIVLFSRQNQFFNIIQIFILLILYTLNLYEVDKIFVYTLYILFVFFLFLGFYYYYLKQLEDKGKRFSYKKFLIGNKEDFYT